MIKSDKREVLLGLIIHKSASSQYFINNKPVKKEQIKQLRDCLKIDLGNLCQFLPQDRVADFVNQSPQARLREFELSVGGKQFVSL